MIAQEYLDRAMNYDQYRNLLEDLMAHGKTTGPNQSEAYLNYAKLNLQRMLRLDKTLVLTDELKRTLKAINKNYTWLVLTEGWCGDAAQNLPVLAAMEKECGHIEMKLLLRDENLQLMDQYLSSGTRSIPKLICVDPGTLQEVFTWGPRPAEVQAMMYELKKNGTSHEEKALLIQKWYNADKTMSLQREFDALIRRFIS